MTPPRGVMATVTLKMVSLLHPTWCHYNTLNLFLGQFTNCLWTLPIMRSECRISGMLCNICTSLWDILYLYIYKCNLLFSINLPTSSTLLCKVFNCIHNPANKYQCSLWYLIFNTLGCHCYTVYYHGGTFGSL